MISHRVEWQDVWLGVAKAVAQRSSCARSKVGAVVVVDNYETYVGYNGPEPGKVNCDEGGCPRGRKTFDELPSEASFSNHAGFCTAIHAEMNAVQKYLKVHPTVQSNAVLFSTREPCRECRNSLWEFGFGSRIVWEG